MSLSDHELINEALQLMRNVTFNKLRSAQDDYDSTREAYYRTREAYYRTKLVALDELMDKREGSGVKACGCGADQCCSSCDPETFYREADPSPLAQCDPLEPSEPLGEEAP